MPSMLLCTLQWLLSGHRAPPTPKQRWGSFGSKIQQTFASLLKTPADRQSMQNKPSSCPSPNIPLVRAALKPRATTANTPAILSIFSAKERPLLLLLSSFFCKSFLSSRCVLPLVSLLQTVDWCVGQSVDSAPQPLSLCVSVSVWGLVVAATN